ncbi:GAF domain-containing protein [Kitasatospora sp. NPDC051853]|uniref:helix-turn-helix domain-containing protein n=1 Tax=Kitasatospora sp. NPDC051853 TaxID=3364058 RepID=UPI0037A6AEC0
MVPQPRRAPEQADLPERYERAMASSTSPPEESEGGPRPEIGDSWDRLRRLGLDPDRGREARRIGPAELEHRRRETHLSEILPVLRATLLLPTSTTPLILAIADGEGHVLWHEGERPLLRTADSIGFETGARWVEDEVGTNGIGLALRVRRPVQVHSAEHYLRSHHSWTCVAAPVHDPRTGRLLGAVNLSGPARSMAPYLLQLAATGARLAEAELRARQLEALHRLRTVATPLLARVDRPAVVVDNEGWTAATVGLPPVPRLRLPAEGLGGSPRVWLPTLGECAVEPLAEGWLIRPTGSPGPDGPDGPGDGSLITLDLRHAARPELTVEGAVGRWSHGLSPRHAELLLLLAVHREGLSAARLSEALFGDPSRTVTVRAEVSRLRRYLGGLLDHRPYRLTPAARVTVLRPTDPYDLLPTSSAPAVREVRSGLLRGTLRLPGEGIGGDRQNPLSSSLS